MLRHTVMFRWLEGTTDAQIDEIAAQLNSAVSSIPEIAEYHHGRDAGLADGNFDYAIVADFATVDDYVVYRDDLEHQRVIAEVIKPCVAQRTAAQYEF